MELRCHSKWNTSVLLCAVRKQASFALFSERAEKGLSKGVSRQADCGKNQFLHKAHYNFPDGDSVRMVRRMLKKARLLTHPPLARRDAPCPRQGHSERRGEEVRTALRVGRSPVQWVLANGKAPTAFPISEKLRLKVELLSDARTKLADFFSILLEFDP